MSEIITCIKVRAVLFVACHVSMLNALLTPGNVSWHGTHVIYHAVQGLAGWLEQASPWLQPLMYKVMYKQAQDFVRATIDHMIKPDSKSTIKDMLVELRSVLVDWQGAPPPPPLPPLSISRLVSACKPGGQLIHCGHTCAREMPGNSPVDQVSKSKTFMRHFTKKLDSVRKSTAPTAPVRVGISAGY